MLEGAATAMARRGAAGVPTAETWVWFVDFNGYALRDNSPSTMVLTAQLLAHYPERLGLVVMYGAPWLFGASWAVVRKLLNEVTASKIAFVRAGDGAALEALALGREMEGWLRAECAENRAPGTRNAAGGGARPPAGAKRYWEHGCDSAGVPKRHDSRGVASHVRSAFFCPLVAAAAAATAATAAGAVVAGSSGGAGASGTAQPAAVPARALAEWGAAPALSVLAGAAAVVLLLATVTATTSPELPAGRGGGSAGPPWFSLSCALAVGLVSAATAELTAPRRR